MFRDHNFHFTPEKGLIEELETLNIDEETRYMYIAVSGTLQDGFPLRKNLDYYENGSLVTPALYLGFGLIRGLKSYFDIKNVHSREYVAHNEGLAKINPCMIATGSRKHANVYAIYLVDVRAGLNALLGEPRYLSMVPDLAKIDLEAQETDENVKKIMLSQIEKSDIPHPNKNEVSIMTVISVYKGPSFVENPVLYTKEDGTEVTNFHEGLAKWAGTSDSLRGKDEWKKAIEITIREQEKIFRDHGVVDELYCSSKNTLRLNTQLTKEQVSNLSKAL